LLPLGRPDRSGHSSLLVTGSNPPWMIVVRLLSHPCLRASRNPCSRSRFISSAHAAVDYKGSMHWHAAVLSARTADTRPSIVVTFDSGKYVFGCGEGASRSYQESTSRWARTRAIFCERTDMRKTSGLAGMYLDSCAHACRYKISFRSDHGHGGFMSKARHCRSTHYHLPAASHEDISSPVRHTSVGRLEQ
jgi:hypothetical protein